MSGKARPSREGKGEWSLVVDYRGFNEQTEHDSYSLPLIDFILQKQQKKRILTVFDLKHGYHQMPLHEDSRPCTAMPTPLGPMQRKVVFMGAKNGNAAFQRMMEALSQPVRDCADPVVDDISIGSGTEENTDTAIPQAPMRSIAMDVFAIPEVGVERGKSDCIICAVDRHSRYIVAVPAEKSKKKDKKHTHGMALQAKTVAQAMIWHWLTICDLRAVICSDRGSQLVGSSFASIWEFPHAKTVAYHSRSNGRAALAARQMFGKLRQLHIKEPGRNWFHSPWRVLQAFHDLPGPTGLSPHRFLFLRGPVSRTLPWINHGKVARDADAMMSEADATAAKVSKSLHDEHERRAKYFKESKVHNYSLKDTVWVERHHKDVLRRDRQQSWYIPGVIVRRIGQDVYAVPVGGNKIHYRTIHNSDQQDQIQ